MRVAIRTILPALLLGVLTTIAVAQAFALRRSPFGPGATGISSSGSVACAWNVSVTESEGLWLAEGTPLSDRFGGMLATRQMTFQSTFPVDQWPFTDCSMNQPAAFAISKACGWPWIAVRGGVVTGPNPATGLNEIRASRGCLAWIVDGPAPTGISRTIVLPLMPAWPGFLLSTLLYCIVWGVLLVLAMQVRQRVQSLTPRAAMSVGIACLALGLVSTILSALLCALLVNVADSTGWGDITGQSFQGPGYRVWWVERHSEPGALRLTSRWIGGGQEIGLPGIPPSPSAQECVPTWAPFLQPRTGVDLDQVQVIADARGWPVPAFCGGFETWRSEPRDASVKISRTFHASVLPRFSANGELSASRTRLIPLNPIWSGLVIDALFFTAGWCSLTLILAGPGVLKRSLRRHRGACLACGYSLRGIASERCPECGATR
ncbi:MAG TPA: hypothetical protein VMS30_07000 [Phycisphaerales bacterium]|nr:hypothetical protein [Phycisphaerales bacterium]